MPLGLNWVDLVVITLIALSALIGVWRGVLREVLSCTVWVLAFVVAFLLLKPVSALLQPYMPVPSVRFILAFGSVFLATLFAGGLVTILLAVLLKRSPVSAVSRLLGMVFGAMRGYLLVLLLVLLTSLTTVPTDPWWQTSQLLPHFQSVVARMEQMLPSAFSSLSAIPS
jgi:membrane protein required for colicin V production